MLNRTHDLRAASWVASAQAEGGDFPLQNLPFGVFRRAGRGEAFRVGVAIGDQVLDVGAAARAGIFEGPAAAPAAACGQDTLNALMAMGPAAWHALREALFDGLRSEAAAAMRQTLAPCLVPQSEVEMSLPARIGNYTDFYTSIHHARNVGRVVRPDSPLPDNFQWLPIAYHGRASSVVASGTPFRRPMGQSRPPGERTPRFGACARLDFELELGIWVGPGNALGERVPITQAEAHVFGLCLLNDWSARDHQFWEMDPLGPFLGKNFCTSVSPWIVTLEALAPFRAPLARQAGDPPALPYLDSAEVRRAGALDIQLEVRLQSAAHRARGLAGDPVTATSFRHQYWSVAQMVTQHTVGGCNLQPGDLLGSGTISGPTPGEAGALVELSRGGTCDVPLPGTGEQRRFLQDGDCVILRGWCERPGAARIGFGECRGEVLPAA